MSLLDHCGTLTCLGSGETYLENQFKNLVSIKKNILLSCRVKPQDRILLLNNNTADFLAMLFAIWSVDATALPVDLKIKGPVYQAFIENYNISFVYDGKTLEPVFKKTSTLTNEDKDIDLILLSSGTTGISKGIGFNKKNIMNRVRAIDKAYGSNANRVLCLLPTSFGHGLIANTLAHFLSGKHIFLSPKFDLGIALSLGRTIDHYSIDCFSSVPALWNLIQASKALRPTKYSLKQVHCASAFLFSETYAFARSWISEATFVINYGLTECSSWISGGELPRDASLYEVGFVGKPLDCHIEINSPNEKGLGMVCIRSESTPTKYVGTLSKNICDPISGYLETGDIGYFKDGNLFLTGRVSDFINQGGEKISPLDIETPALSYPNVLRAVAIPVEHNILGEQIGLIVETKNPGQFNEVGLKKHLSQFLPNSKVPKIILATEHIPLNENLKINRLELRKFFESQLGKK